MKRHRRRWNRPAARNSKAGIRAGAHGAAVINGVQAGRGTDIVYGGASDEHYGLLPVMVAVSTRREFGFTNPAANDARQVCAT